jgi:hypothetical protein
VARPGGAAARTAKDVGPDVPRRHSAQGMGRRGPAWARWTAGATAERRQRGARAAPTPGAPREVQDSRSTIRKLGPLNESEPFSTPGIERASGRTSVREE